MTSTATVPARPAAIRDRFRLLVFDWDGTLMDSAAGIVGCMTRAIGDLGFDLPEELALRGTIGLSLDESFGRLFPRCSAAQRLQAVERYRYHWLLTYRHRTLLFDGVRAALDALHERRYFLAVATGKSRAGLDRDLASNRLARYFLATRTPQEAPSKPHPQMLLDIMDELGAAPEETLMIGDTTYDLEMARHAGTAAVGVLTGTHPEAALRECEPLACLAGVEALPGWLAGS
jgi:phosphoglycolate phosphatase